MTEAAGALDAWGSALIGGLASAVAVLLAVFVTFYLTNRRARETERRQAAARLMVEVSNVRDAACSHTTGPIGDYVMHNLRNRLYTTYVPLHDFESFKVVDAFYRAVNVWRDWGRQHDDQLSEDLPRIRSMRVQKKFPWIEQYMTGLRKNGEEVIDILKDKLEATGLNYKPPTLPTVDDTVGGPDLGVV
jgi:hypothetical protein